MTVITGLGKLRQEDREFKVSLNYIDAVSRKISKS